MGANTADALTVPTVPTIATGAERLDGGKTNLGRRFISPQAVAVQAAVGVQAAAVAGLFLSIALG